VLAAAELCTVGASVFLAARLLLPSSGLPGPLALPILGVPCVVAVLTYRWPHSLALLVLADVVLALDFVLLLLGGAAFLYLPALTLMLVATVMEAGSRPDHGSV
jgi:hypothetical protein